jgi:hypothetical protein
MLTGDQRKYDKVSLGIMNKKLMNADLLSKWLGKLSQNEQRLWADLIRAKYITDRYLFFATPKKGSQAWNSLEKIKHLFKLGTSFRAKNRRMTELWTETWLGIGI